MVSRSLLHTIRNHFVASLGEFVGTFLFLFFAFAATQTANQQLTTSSGPNTAQLLYISLAFGFSLAINVWIFFRVSGGLFNPAVTIALCICQVVPVVRSIFIFVAQILGAIAAAGVVRGLIPGGVLYNVVLDPNTSVAQGLFLEMFLTAELVFTILMLAAEKQKSTFVAPVGIGLALFVAELVGVYWTGGALNPARAFGPCVVQGSFPGYHWLYWLGPVLGALLASAFYGVLKYLNYEEVNGDQDKSEEEAKDNESPEENKKSNRGSSSKYQGESANQSRNRDEEESDYNYENRASGGNDDNINRGGSRKSKTLSSAPLHNQRWSRSNYPEEDNHEPYTQDSRHQQSQDSSRPLQTIHNSRHNSQTRTTSDYPERESRSRFFVPDPSPIIQYNQYDYELKENSFNRPTDPSTGKVYIQDTDAPLRAARRVSLSRRERELGYRTDNVDEIGGNASQDVHRAGSAKKSKRY